MDVPEIVVDEIDLDIVAALAENARASFAQVGRKVGLTGAAIAERVKRLEDAGIIGGYHAEINLAKIGLESRAFVRVKAPRDQFTAVIALAREIPEVRKCVHVDGDPAFYLLVAAPSEPRMREIVEQFRRHGEADVDLIVSTPVQKYAP
jgi:Lrp/AsnC family leucine-responsive transcriptional regulator